MKEEEEEGMEGIVEFGGEGDGVGMQEEEEEEKELVGLGGEGEGVGMQTEEDEEDGGEGKLVEGRTMDPG